MRKPLGLLLVVLGCATPDTREDVQGLLTAGPVAPPKLNLAVKTVATSWKDTPEHYRIGIMDVLHIEAEGRPEFGRLAALRDGATVGGRRVLDDGKVYLPLLGGVPAAGRTLLELRTEVNELLKKFLDKPAVTIDVLEYRSQRYFVLGAFRKPGVFFVDGARTLLESIGLAGGIAEGGDIEGAYVVRGHKLLPISLGDLLLRGDTRRNIRMRDGDLVYVPDAVKWEVYVLGEVTKPGVVRMPQTGLSLAAAVAEAGGLDPLYADRNVVRVFRGSWQAPRVFTITAEDLYRVGSHIALHPGDRIHVAASGLATWYRTLNLMLPVLQTAVTGTVAAAALGD